MQSKYSGHAFRVLPVLLALVLGFSSLVGCGQSTTPTEPSGQAAAPRAAESTATAKPSVSQIEVIRAAAEKYLGSSQSADSNLKVEDLYYMLNDGDASNDPFIVSVRAPADYEKGHIPGAINIPWREVAKKENLAKLPKGKLIVVYCYTGQTGSQATAILNLLGYNVKNLRYGMASWTKDETVAPNRLDIEKTVKDYKTETTVNKPTKTYELPVVNNTSSTDEFEIIRAAAEAYLNSARAQNTNIKAEDLFYALNDGDSSNDPYIVSVRATADYELGHVPGAINIPWREIAKKENLAKLPKDKVIVAYCYTGHTGSQATAILNLLGYEVRNMSHGISSWTKNMDVVKTRFDNSKDSKDYRFVVGVNPR